MSEHKILRKLHIVMFPWFAIGHMTPYIHLANMLAERGHKISYLLPKKAELQLKHLILHPNLVTFHTITVPQADGLPPGTETCSEIPIHMTSSLAAAMDLTRCQVEEYVSCMKPDFVFYDTAHWVPEIAKKLSAKSVCYNAVSAAALAIAVVPARNLSRDRKITEGDLSKPPEGYPSSTIVFQPHEGRSLSFITHDFGDGILFYERVMTAMQECDAIALRTCQEFEGSLCDYLSSQYRKPVFLTGPVLPEPKKHVLEDKWAAWLEGFEPGSVVYCAFGSQHILQKDQFQEMLLGFEMTGLPFLLALKPPMGTTTLEEAMPEGYQERVAGRGLVTGEWVPQVAILDHPSVGCFVSHCGFGSMWESLMSDCQIVLAPHLGDQILNTRLLAAELKVAVEVERKENGWFSKESLSIAINSLMDKDSQEGEMVKKNHAKWRDILKNPEFMTGYVDRFVKNLHDLLDCCSVCNVTTTTLSFSHYKTTLSLNSLHITPKPSRTVSSLSLSSSRSLSHPLKAIPQEEDVGPIELPPSNTPLFPTTTGDESSPLQLSVGILLTGAVSVLLFRSLRRRAERAKQLKFRSSAANKTVKEEALDNLKSMGSAPITADAPPSPVQALLGGISAGVIALILYKFTTTVEAGLNRQTLPDNFSVRQITITIRTIINGLCYLATFVFGLNSVGLVLYSGQLALDSMMQGSTQKEAASKGGESSGSLNSMDDQSSDNTQ